MPSSIDEKRLEAKRNQARSNATSIGPGQSLIPDSHDFDGMQMLKNAPPSAKQLVKDTSAALFHPIDTVKGIFNALTNPGQIIEALNERYGSIDNAQKSLEQDPMGVASDILGVVTLGATAVPRVPGIKKVPRSIMESTTKFPTGMNRADRARNIDTMLKERITPDDAGLDKLDEIVAGVNKEIDAIISQADVAGTTIPAADVIAPLNAVIGKVKDSLSPDKANDLKRLQEVRKQFNANLEGATELSPQRVQQLKKDLYERINFDSRSGTASEVGQRGRKAVAQGARSGVSDIDPRIAALNGRQAPLLDMRQDLERAAGRIGNRNNVGGLGPMVGAAAGGTMGAMFGSPTAGAVIGAGLGKVATSPKVAARAAIMMEQLIDAGQSAASAQIIVQQALEKSGRSREESRR